MKYNTADVRFVKFVYLTFLCPLSPAVAYSVTLFHNDKRKYYSRVKFNCEVVHMRSTIMSWSLLLKSGHQHQRLHRYFICSLETCQIKILKPFSRLVVYFTSSFDATRVFFFSVVTRWTGLADITISIILARDKWTKPLQSSNERKLTCLFFQLLMGEKDEYFFFLEIAYFLPNRKVILQVWGLLCQPTRIQLRTHVSLSHPSARFWQIYIQQFAS